MTKTAPEISPFRPGDLAELDLQPSQAWLQNMIADADYAVALDRHTAATLRRADAGGSSRAICCAGLVHKWPGTLTAWALVSAAMTRRDWPFVAKAMAQGIASAFNRPEIWRIETHVLDGFAPGHTLMGHLGFVVEGLAQAWGPDGNDYWLYARLPPPRRIASITVEA